MALTTQQERLRGLLREALGLLEPEEPPVPATNVATERAPWEEDTDQQCITGKVGNPGLTRPRDKALWKAGIGVPDANGKLHWTNVIAWGEIAERADQFSRGDMVTVCGKPQTRRYVDSNGVAQVRDDFVISSIDWAE
jgi:hypothetical protein